MKNIKIGSSLNSNLGEDYYKKLSAHISNIDKQLVQELIQHNGFKTAKYIELLDTRGFTFVEYLTIFNPPSSSSDYYKYPVF